jgi:nucleotide-binding universal stress UspA family protein
VDLADDHPSELQFAIELARTFGAKVLLLHVVDYVPTVLPVELPAGYPTPQLDVVQQSAERKLAEVAKKFEGLDVSTMVEVGAAAHEITACAEREGADHIVVGSHGHGALARIVLGSVAERVARTAPCPVTIVRERS